MSLVIQRSLALLKSYDWGRLWAGIKSVSLDSNTAKLDSLEQLQLYAIKQMLLAGWWQETDDLESRLLDLEPYCIDESLIHFCTLYCWIAKGESKKVNILRKKTPVNSPKWIQIWLDIEIYGRTCQFKK